MTQLSGPAKSQEKRTAKLRLDEEGTLEGEVRVEYTGHAAIEMKESYDDDAPAARRARVSRKSSRRTVTRKDALRLTSSSPPTATRS